MAAVSLPIALSIVWLVTQPHSPSTSGRAPSPAAPASGVRDIDELVRLLNQRLAGLADVSRDGDPCGARSPASAACSRAQHEKVIVAQEVTARRSALSRRIRQLGAIAHRAGLAQADRRVTVPVLALPPAPALRLASAPAHDWPSASISARALVAPMRSAPLARLPPPDVAVSATSPAWLTDDLALLRPVDGRLLPQLARGRYGRGLLIEVGEPRPVAAPAAGVVRFAGTLHGYGLVLIIEHGSGYHSVLAGLARLDVDEATDVVAGQTVGSITAANGVGRLYVELRRHGAPLNPAAWTAAREDKVAG